MSQANELDHAIAIIGLAGRFPGAQDVDAFWCNLCAGVESISVFSDEELLAQGVDPATLEDPNYVKAHAILDDIESFDASFFDFNPREAEILDPQHRLFLECAWQALENAGYDPERFAGLIGVYAGVSISTYWMSNLAAHPELIRSVGGWQMKLLNDKDYLPTRVSYKLNLRGPSVNVQTACSTSLVATHLACQSLLNGECDIALAGGVTATVPQRAGYQYREGGINSPDGHCRPFDADAQGTVSGSGLGIVVLKPLVAALEDGDRIHAMIRGSAINNDGALKVGFTAPSETGQAAVIAEALGMAGVHPETIAYIETHGTGTVLGDPIEIAALTRVFRKHTDKAGFCAIGSVKGNIGHLDSAAGITGLIKAVLALENKTLPPSLHFQQPNPRIDFASSPFYVNTQVAEWKSNGSPRRAGVSSLGIGGTNAHIILEEAPPIEPSGPSRPWQLILLSAKTPFALRAATANLLQHVKQYPDLNLADVAYTLQVGRRAFNQRGILVCRDVADAIHALETQDPERVFSYGPAPDERPVVFMFPGQGTQHPNMGLELYQVEPVFREHLDRCAELLQPQLGIDLRRVLYPEAGQEEWAAEQLEQTWLTQPALFAVEYALAQLWMAWGVRPEAMIGHSIGEYVAACLSGVLSLEDALALVVARGRLMQDLPPGAMLSVPLPESDLAPWLDKRLSLAAVNSAALCTASGPVEDIEDLQRRLEAQGIECRRLHTSHAFHSTMMDAALEPFAEQVRRVRLSPPQIPYLSNVSGTWITAGEATDPVYWANQLRQPVRFADGVGELLKDASLALLEVGPGRTLSTLARQQVDAAGATIVLSSLRHVADLQPDEAFLLTALGKLWLAGVAVDWDGFYAHERRLRAPLPTYPFERQRYWIDLPGRAGPSAAVEERSAPADLDRSIGGRHARPNLMTPYVAPSTEIEQSIAAIWRELLGIDEIGIHDNFFELRGHSLMATQMVARLREVFLLEVPLRSFVAAPTIAQLTQVIEELFLEKIESLPEEEVQRLIENFPGADGEGE